MRHWQLDNKKPLALQLAADARLTTTYYHDDQSWHLQLGNQGEAGLVFQAKYGGRAGLASLVPMWTINDRLIYETQAYHTPPIITAFAPSFAEAQADLLPELSIRARYWVASSLAVTGTLAVTNTSSHTHRLRLDLYAHAIIRSQELQIAILTLANEENALYLGKVGNIDPVILVAGGHAGVGADGHIAPKVGREVDIPANGQATFHWASAALPEMKNSLRRARYWLAQDFDTAHEKITQAATALPQVTLGKLNQEATLAFGAHHTVQAFLSPTADLPAPSFVTGREPSNGYSTAGDGSDYPRTWSGQSVPAAYLLGNNIASIAPSFAEGIIQNYLHTQHEDGWIDAAPGIAGQRQDLLALPVLARLTWNIYQQTQNSAFLETSFVGLNRFLSRWFQQDVDNDGVPEWQSVAQTGYPGWPLFTTGGVNINAVETPDLVAYLLSEVEHLLKMAALLEDNTYTQSLELRQTELTAVLQDMWQGERFAYRDRDTHTTPTRQDILQKAPADAEHLPALTLGAPARLVIEAVGGASNKPQFSVTLTGSDADENPITETLTRDDFTWTYGRGAATSTTVFSQVDRIQSNGLSRVFRLNAHTTGLATDDLNTVIPLITGALRDGQIANLVEHIKTNLLATNGVTLFPNSDEPGTDKSGVWVFWNTLICEALLGAGYSELAVDILKRLLRVQTATLRESGVFTTFYDEDDMHGKGTRLDLNGIVPLHLFMAAFGLRFHPDGAIQILASFPWGEPVTVEQYGIRVARSPQQTTVTYPGNTTETIPTGTAKMLTPPADFAQPTPQLDLPAKPEIIPADPPNTPVKIEVQVDDEAPPNQTEPE